MLGKVVVIGRPNVGKSSFFNMYVGHKIAVVADEAGTTRDISEYEYTDEDREITYILSDSGGLDFSSDDQEINKDIMTRTKEAINDSDLVIWLVEYDKFTQLDENILKMVRQKEDSDVLIVANKADNDSMKMEAYSHELIGMYDNFFITSTSHNSGFDEIRSIVAKKLKAKGLNYFFEELDESVIKLSLVGRPNVGKSSLINAITGKNRVMVKDMSGTTRDSIDTKFHYEDKDYVLIDTAGIRRLSRVGTRNIENWSIMRTTRAISRSDVVCVGVDGIDGIHQQDLSIISSVLEEKKGLIVAINKWDGVLNKTGADKDNMMDRYIAYLSEKIEFIPWVSVIFTSAVNSKRVDEILKRANEIKNERQKRVKTGIFNTFIEQVVLKHPPTGNRVAHKPKIYYGTQADTNPPKFVLTVNNPDHFHFSYKRYLENKIRDNFGFAGTPIIIEYRGRGKNKDMIK